MQVLNPNPYVPQDQQFIPKQDEIIKQCQWFAINQWLSSYPESMTYEDIIDQLQKDTWSEPIDEDDEDDNRIVEWYLIEGHSGDQIAEFIQDTYTSALNLVRGVYGQA